MRKGREPTRNPAAAVARRRGVTILDRLCPNIDRVAQIRPASAQTKTALFHRARPRKKKPRGRSHLVCSCAYLTRKKQPVTSKRCSSATGPQSKVLVRRNV